MSAGNDTFTHVQTVLGGDVRIALVHGRLHWSFKAVGHRVPVTVPINLDDAETLFSRGLEMVRIGRAARDGA